MESKGGTEINATIARFIDANLGAEVKVFEIAKARVKKMADFWTGTDENAIFDAPISGLRHWRLPPCQVFAIK